MPTVNANKHTAHDLQLAGQMRREDYKTIKHMDKATLAAYLSRVWKRGYDAGYQRMRPLSFSSGTRFFTRADRICPS